MKGNLRIDVLDVGVNLIISGFVKSVEGIFWEKMPKKDIYRGKEWSKLDPLRRALILLVSEGVKPGATFGLRYRVGLERVLEKLRLPYLSPEWDKNRYFYTIAKDDKTLLKYVGQVLDKDITERQAHQIYGIFYGIPECCIDKYVGAFIVNENFFYKRGKVFFDDLLKEYQRLNGGYPDELDYRIPGITPCKVDCDNMLKVCRQYRDVLLQYDREAVEELRLFNKMGYRIIRNQLHGPT